MVWLWPLVELNGPPFHEEHHADTEHWGSWLIADKFHRGRSFFKHSFVILFHSGKWDLLLVSSSFPLLHELIFLLWLLFTSSFGTNNRGGRWDDSCLFKEIVFSNYILFKFSKKSVYHHTAHILFCPVHEGYRELRLEPFRKNVHSD